MRPLLQEFSNLIIDDKNHNAVKILQTLKAHNLVQHFSSANHNRGHILDLPIIRSESTVLIAEPSVHDPNLFDAHENSLCDHHSIQKVLSFGKPMHTVKEITFRKWKNVDLGEISKDITLDIPDKTSSITQIPLQHHDSKRCGKTCIPIPAKKKNI